MSKSCEVVVMVTVEDPVPWGVNEYQTSRDVGLDDKSLAGAGAGMLKLLEVAEVRDPDVNVIVALDTAAALVAVRLENVATPDEALTEVVPPSVQVPASPFAAVIEAELPVTVLPY